SSAGPFNTISWWFSSRGRLPLVNNSARSRSRERSAPAQVVDQQVDQRLELIGAAGRTQHLDAALDAGHEGSGDPIGVQVRADQAVALHGDYARTDPLLPLAQQLGHHSCRARSARHLVHERTEGAIPAL